MLCLFAAGAQAATTDPLIEGAKLCTKQLPQYEKEYGIPAHLLSAIATTESGRYHEGLQIKVPWPWTINAAGKGYFFNSKAEAIAATRKLMARGVQSIDIGCMQVNIHHHPKAFASLSDAFDPGQNIAYAAGFLRDLYVDSGSWKKAAAGYHSKTPAKGSQYVGRVYDSWHQLVDKLKMAKLTIPSSSLNAMKEMKPKTGVQYASLEPKRIKMDPLPEQTGRKVPSYAPPRMNTVQLSDKLSRREEALLVVRSEIKTAAAAAPALPDTGMLRIDSRGEANNKKNGPNFIFND